MSETLKFILQNVLTGVTIVLLMQWCGKQEPIINTVHTETTRIYDSTRKTIEPKTLPASVITITVPIPTDQKIDSLQIVKAYFAVRTYSQQFQDSSIRAVITNTVFQNQLHKTGFDYQLLKPIETIKSTTLTVLEENWGFYAGGFVSISMLQQRLGIGPKVSFLTKNNTIVSYGFDIPNKTHEVGTQFKINAGRYSKNKRH